MTDWFGVHKILNGKCIAEDYFLRSEYVKRLERRRYMDGKINHRPREW